MPEVQNLRGTIVQFREVVLNGAPVEVKGDSVKSHCISGIDHLDVPQFKAS